MIPPRKRGIPAKIDQHPAFKEEAKKMLMKGCTNSEICEVLNRLVIELRFAGELKHLPPDFEFSITNVGHAAPKLTKELKELQERKRIERQKRKAVADVLKSESVDSAALDVAGSLLDDMLARVVMLLDSRDTEAIASDEMMNLTLAYKRLMESKRIQAALIDAAIKKRDRDLLEAAKKEATIINETASNGVDFVKRLIEQVNANNK